MAGTAKKKIIIRFLIILDLIALTTIVLILAFSDTGRSAFAELGDRIKYAFTSERDSDTASASTKAEPHSASKSAAALVTRKSGLVINSATVTNSPTAGKSTVTLPAYTYNSSLIQSKKLDTGVLDKLDNTKYEWWIRLNDEHKTPEITPAIQEMLHDNGGIYVGNTDTKTVYLTIDEGYENGYTPSILDTLKANNTKATFFITGAYIESHPELVLRMTGEGHVVGSHTVNHPSLPGVGYNVFEYELNKLEDSYYKLTGKTFRYLRPPMGEYSIRSLAAAKQLGYLTVFWSFAYADWDTTVIRGAAYAHDIVMKNLHNGAIILLHAVSKDNTEALDSIIKDIKSEGYEIRPLDL